MNRTITLAQSTADDSSAIAEVRPGASTSPLSLSCDLADGGLLTRLQNGKGSVEVRIWSCVLLCNNTAHPSLPEISISMDNLDIKIGSDTFASL